MTTASSIAVAKRVVTNLDRCIECGSCAAACYVSHGNMPAVNFAQSGAALLPVICRQCKAAACVEACPVEAMVLDEAGVVRRRIFRCIGCGSCARACPFGVLPARTAGVPAGFRSTDRMSGHQIPKCDLCEDRTAGADGDVVPRCVAACPAGALMFVDEHRAAAEHLAILGGRTTGENPYKRR
ncbi:MAG TPA: 4Fe-4S dicluster domain-containing protein [Phycisphaerae bacterium]|nr:4Fe-4S dicluster domain-containing protein [Phycisphaerae bacterium]HUT60919.1 4Fe-4S dicluster domain-containing protein [Phycisphaerae bacterium]